MARAVRTRPAGWVAGVVALLVLEGLVAFPLMFGVFQSYDDEGYLLVSLRGWLDQGDLYGETYSQYGPAYHVLIGGLHAVLGSDPNLFSGRLLNLSYWLVGSVLVGVIIYARSRTAWVALAGQLAAFVVLVVAVNEPAHPGAFVTLAALVVMTVLATGWAERTAGAVVIGAALAIAVLTKVNIGGVVGIGVLLYYVGRAGLRWPRRVVAAGAVLAPFVLIADELGSSPGFRNLAILSAVGVAAALAVPGRATPEPRARRALVVATVAAVITVVVVVGVVLARRTDLAELWRGVIAEPLQLQNLFVVPPLVPGGPTVVGVLGAGLVVVLARLATGRHGSATETVRWVAVGCGGAALLAGTLGGLGLDWRVALLPLAVCAVLGRSGEDDGFELVLAVVASLFVLQAYPLAGSQLGFGLVLLVPAAALAIAAADRRLREAVTVPDLRGAGAVALAVLGCWAVVTMSHRLLRFDVLEQLSEYGDRSPLALSGSRWVRLAELESGTYAWVVAELRERCDTFWTDPGLNSFYVWSDLPLPTTSNTTVWAALFDDERQQLVVDRLEEIDRLCLLRNTAVAGSWASPDDGPLVRYVAEGWTSAVMVDGFEVLERAPG